MSIQNEHKNIPSLEVEAHRGHQARMRVFSFATVKCKQIQVGGSNGFNFRYEADASETCKFKQELSKELSAHALTVRFPSQ